MSRILYVKCDRCGNEFIPSETQRVGWVGLNWKDPDTDDLTDTNPFRDQDFCEECMRDIAAFIENQPTIVNIELPEPVEVKPKKAKPKKAKKEVDKGKIKALHDAGWSAAKIADEMKVSPQTINYHLRRMLYGGDADDRSGEGKD